MPFSSNPLLAPVFQSPVGDGRDHRPPVVSIKRAEDAVESGVRLHHNQAREGYILQPEVEGLGVAPVEVQSAPLASGGSVARHSRLTEGDVFLPITLVSPVPSALPSMFDALVDVARPGQRGEDGLPLQFEVVVFDPYGQETRSRRLIFESGLGDPVRVNHHIWRTSITGRFVDPFWYGTVRELRRVLGSVDKKFITAKQGPPDPTSPPAVTYEWEGEPHNSPSVKRVNGEVVAKNHVPNPRFENGLSHWTPASAITSNVQAVDSSSAFVGSNLFPDAEFTPQGLWNVDAYWFPLGAGVLEIRGRWADEYSYNIPASSIPVEEGESVRVSFQTHLVSGYSYLPPTLIVEEIDHAGHILGQHEVVTASTSAVYVEEFTATAPGVEAIRVGFRTDPLRTFSTRCHITDAEVLKSSEVEGKHIKVHVPADRTVNNDLDMSFMDVAVGQWVAVSSYVSQAGSEGTVQYQYRVRSSDGSWSYPADPIVVVGGGQWFTSVVQIPAEGDGGYMGLRVSFRDQSGADNDMYGTRFQVVIADTEAEALEQVEHYFDGDTPDVPSRQIGGYEFPFFPVRIGGSVVQGEYELQVEGDAPAYWSGVITPPGEDLLIQNAKGERIFVQGRVDEPILIQTRPQEQDITLADGTPIWDRIDPGDDDFFALHPGRNTVHVSMVGATQQSEILIRYREAFFHALGGGQ